MDYYMLEISLSMGIHVNSSATSFFASLLKHVEPYPFSQIF